LRWPYHGKHVDNLKVAEEEVVVFIVVPRVRSPWMETRQAGSNYRGTFMQMSISIFNKEANLDVLNHPILNAIYYTVSLSRVNLVL
jgi:hypothetical protein